MENLRTYETQIDNIIETECCQKITAADAAVTYFLQKGKGTGLVLKSDMKLELGGSQNTFSIICPSYITDSGVFLCGEDFATNARSLPFGLLIKVAGNSFDEEMHYQLSQVLHGMMQTEGYMVKKNNQAFLCRVSNKAIQNGLTFAVLGEILIWRIKERFTAAEHVQVFYITSSTANFEAWHCIAQEMSQSLKNVQSAVWQSRGINMNECLKLGHCGKCSSKDVCDKARQIGLQVVTHMKAE
jgi:Zn ribbon nucleic-acid-binding protein